MLGKLVHSKYALYIVSVRRCGTLPTASFRFPVARDTLAVQLMVPTTKPIADFHCQVIAHVGRTQKKPTVSTTMGFSHFSNCKSQVERVEELEKLKELGVDFGQGYFLARPEYPAPTVSQKSIKILLSSKKESSNNSSSTVMEITHDGIIIDPETTVGEVYSIFEKSPELEGLAIGNDALSCGLIMRDKLFHDLSSQYGFAL